MTSKSPTLRVKKLHPDATVPTYGSPGAIGLDLSVRCERKLGSYCLDAGDWAAYPTGIAVAIPKGWYGRIAPRSGLALNKAIDVLDEAGAAQMLVPENKRKKTITVREIEDVVAKMARMPSKTVSVDDAEALRNLEKNLKLTVFGQDKAITELAAAVKMARAGLREETKPMGCYLFTGPTGVGKTEIARRLAKLVNAPFIKVEATKFTEVGYVGRDVDSIIRDLVEIGRAHV